MQKREKTERSYGRAIEYSQTNKYDAIQSLQISISSEKNEQK